MRDASFDFVRFVHGIRGAALFLALAAVAGAPGFVAAGPSAGVSPTTSTGADWTEAVERVPLAANERLVAGPRDLANDEADRRLLAAGYRVAVAIPPDLRIVRATHRSGPLPAGFVLRAAGPARSPAAASTVPAPSASAILAPSDGGNDDPFHGMGDALPPASAPLEPPSRTGTPFGAPPLPSGLFYGTRWEDLSEFMVGKVAIGIYFPESDGSLDLNRYDWTPALRDSVVRSAVRGFLGWTQFAAARGVDLSFYLEIHPSLPTRYEPISRPTSGEELWIEDMFRPIVGYKSDASTATYDVANGLRSRLGTQWAGLVIAVQNDTSSTGTFPDGLIAHAKLGGPWFVIPVNNAKSQSASLDFYMRHEVTHLFWALDEYPANNAWWSCVYATGYFNRPNWNSDIPFPGYCEPHVDCLMRGNFPNSLCHRTEEQVGWVDANQNTVMDLFETRPLAFPDSSKYRLSAGNPLVLRGRVGESALPNVNPYRFYAGDSISVSVIDSILYRVDAGPWISLMPVDGVFDEGEERFDFTLAPLAIGNHTIEWQARNSNGQSAPFTPSTAVTVSGSAGTVEPPGTGAPALRLAVGPSPGRSPIRFTLSGARGASTLVRLWTPSGALARTWILPSNPTGSAWSWDGRLRGGERAPSGVYFVTVDANGERLRRRLVYLR